MNPQGRAADFTIKNVVVSTSGTLKRNFFTLILLSLFPAGLVFCLGYLLNYDALIEMADRHPDQNTTFASFRPFLYLIALEVIFFLILHAAVTRCVVDDLSGRPVRFRNCFFSGLEHMLPVVIVGCIMSIGIFLGLVFLIAPGIMLALVWVVAIPVQVAENSTIPKAFIRSRALTQGNHLKNFCILLIFVPIYFATNYILNLAFGISRDTLSSLGTNDWRYFSLVFHFFLLSVPVVIWMTIVSTIYHELRRAREGTQPVSLEKVFE